MGGILPRTLLTLSIWVFITRLGTMYFLKYLSMEWEESYSWSHLALNVIGVLKPVYLIKNWLLKHFDIPLYSRWSSNKTSEYGVFKKAN